VSGYEFDVFVSYIRSGNPYAWVSNHFLPRLRDCLADELRRLDPDELYGEVITSGLSLLGDAEAEGVHA